MSWDLIILESSRSGRLFKQALNNTLYLAYLLGYTVIMLLNALRNRKTWSVILYNGLVSLSHKAQANVLVFGGNGFIGSECVKTLLKDGHRLTLINRGNEYWDSAARIKPFVNEVHCNRNNGLENCVNFVGNDSTRPFDIVLDFSAYHPGVIDNVFTVMKDKIGTYIYISSDSVYEVSEPSSNKLSKEEDAVRPKSKELMMQLNEKDQYGNFKFGGEEYLQSRYNTSHVPYVILRLPDVIGPRDTTGRWWPYQAWFQYHSSFNKSLLLPHPLKNIETSYVYVKDVAEAIRKIVSEILLENHTLDNEVFNLAFPDKYSLRRLLDSMQEALGVQGVEYRYDDNAYHLYPSVLRGPVDITKAQEKLKWNPTPWPHAIMETVDFYKDAIYKFPSERNTMMKTLQAMVGDDFPDLALKIESDLIKKVKRQKNPDGHIEF